MDKSNVVELALRALKLINGTEDKSKHEGLNSLNEILHTKDQKLVEYGYDQVILKEILKLVKFESGTVLDKAFKLLQVHYYPISKHQDQLAEGLLYRYGLAGDIDVSKMCLENVSCLIDHMDDNVAKHSKQILKVADLNTIPDLNSIISEILLKMKTKLPIRRSDI